jgi:hypothetical protein
VNRPGPSDRVQIGNPSLSIIATSDSGTKPVCNARIRPGGSALPVAVSPTTISLRADGVRLARFEALGEKAHKLGLVPAGADRLDLVLAGL